MRLFALEGNSTLADAVATELSHPLDPHEHRDFEGGEHKARPMVSVRGQDVFVIADLSGGSDASTDQRLIRLLFFLATCRENGAERITAIAPYLCYSRKDRQTKRHDPVTTRHVARLFDAVGCDRLITFDVHNIAAFQNAFRCGTIHLEARSLFSARIEALAGESGVTVFSPDGGGVKRAELMRESYERQTGKEAAFGFMEKHRSRGVVSGSLFAGDVANQSVFIVDDMVSTGGTLLRAAHACREHGASAVYAMATHGLFVPERGEVLDDPAIDRIIVTDSVAAARFVKSDRLEVVTIAPMIAKAIQRLHAGDPLDDLIALED